MLTIGLIIILLVVVIFIIAQYNSLIKYRNWVKESWSQIDVQLKRRHDLIPNLVNTVKGYAKHEQDTLNQVIQARNQLLSGSTQERMDANNQIEQSLKSIFALSESYPDLKANENFLKLQEELSTTENKVAYSRQLYNKTTAEYNIKRETFPTIIIARILGFKQKDLLSTPEEEKHVPDVSF